MVETKRRRKVAAPTIRARWFVAGDVHVHGCKHYNRSKPEIRISGDVERSTWQTKATTDSLSESRLIQAARRAIHARISDACARTTLGWFAKDEDQDKLAEAIEECTVLCNEYNLQAKHTRVWHDFTPLEITDDGGLLARNVWDDVRAMLADLAEAMSGGDLRMVRDRLKELADAQGVLPVGRETALGGVIDNAKQFCKEIRRHAERLDTEAAQEIIRRAVAPVEVQRLLYAEALGDEEKDGEFCE